MRKAYSPQEARETLLLQSGSRVDIYTATFYHTPRLRFGDLSVTRYHFAPFDEKALDAYLEGGLWQGKAGACMVEGFCKPYIRHVQGYESCAMGLTLERVVPFLEADV